MGKFLGKSGSQCRLPLHKLGHLSVKCNLLEKLFLNKIQSSNLKTHTFLPNYFPVWNRHPITMCLGCCHFGQNQLDPGACLKSLQLPIAFPPTVVDWTRACWQVTSSTIGPFILTCFVLGWLERSGEILSIWMALHLISPFRYIKSCSDSVGKQRQPASALGSK